MNAPHQESRVVMVTGGTQDIGRGISMKLMEERYHVIVTSSPEGRENKACPDHCRGGMGLNQRAE